MANTVRLKRSAVQGKAPVVGDLALGELAVNTYDGKLYTKKNDGSDAIVEIGGGAADTFDRSGTTVSLVNTGDTLDVGPFFVDGSAPADSVNIDSDGNFGIGTANPLRVLSVSSTQGVVGRFESTGARARVGLKDVNTTTDSHVGIGSAGDNFLIYAGQAEKVRVTSSGNVGIGTTTPSVSLDLDTTDAVKMPAGTTAQRPGTPANGQQRYNSDLGAMEIYVQSQWQPIQTDLDYGLITTSATTTLDYGALS